MKNNLRNLTLSLAAATVLTAPLAFAEQTAVTSGVKQALSDSKVNLSFRVREEFVDEDNAKKNANALTVKSRLTLQTGAYQNLSLGLEVDNTSDLVDNYNNKVTGDAAYSVVADPTGTDVNQAFVQYKHGKLTAKLGRQRILHDGQRFVGGVGWRQNEQTYDGLRLQYQLSDALLLDYSYVNNVNNILAKNITGDLHLTNVAYKINKSHKITAFNYLLDYSNASNSTNTYGALYNGKFGPVFVNASAASQSDYGDNTKNFSADYLNLEVGTKFSGITVLGGYELLGSDNGVAFSTPLATGHKFNGWADKFLGTPAEGLEDIYLTFKGAISGVKLTATYHDFSSDVDGIDYGSEIDVVAAYKISSKYSALVKYAGYSADAASVDTTKVWLQLAAKF